MGKVALHPFVLLGACAFAACTVEVQPQRIARDPEPATAAAPDVEITGEVSARDRAVFDLWVSRPQNRYRLECRSYAVVGTLDPPDWSFLLDLQAETVTPNDDELLRRLRDAGDRERETNHRNALRISHAAESAGLARFAFNTPCEDARAVLGAHDGCQKQTLPSGLEQWAHEKSTRQGLYSGFGKNTTRVEHDFDPTRSLLMCRRVTSSQGSGTSTGPSLRVDSTDSVPASAFDVPSGFREF